MTGRRVLGLGLLAGLALQAAGCAQPGVPRKSLEGDPGWRLAQLLSQIEATQAAGSECYDADVSPTTDCERLLAGLELLALEHPRHLPTLLANAYVAHQTDQNDKALSYLNLLFGVEPAHADAAVLRGQISIEAGNLPFAIRFLREQAAIDPAHPELRETLAAAYYLSGDMERARASLEAAERLGAPRWRVCYHLGLVAESAGDALTAEDYYRRTLDERPGFEPARSRLTGLENALP